MGEMTASHVSGVPFASTFADERALRAWYDETAPRVFAYVLLHCGGQVDLAEEVTQQVFADAFAPRTRYDGRATTVTWLCAIARHKLADRYRAQVRQRRLLAAAQAEAVEARDDLGRVELRHAVVAALERLPRDQRSALIMRHVDGMSVPEIAEWLERSVHATESLLARARGGFRRAYGVVGVET